MAKDQRALNLYRRVLLARGHVAGYVQWKRVALGWLSSELPNITARYFHELMQDYVRKGGAIHQVVEKRPEYVEYRFHYDLRIPILNRTVYVETVFYEYPDPDDCTIWVVSVHDA